MLKSVTEFLWEHRQEVKALLKAYLAFKTVSGVFNAFKGITGMATNVGKLASSVLLLVGASYAYSEWYKKYKNQGEVYEEQGAAAKHIARLKESGFGDPNDIKSRLIEQAQGEEFLKLTPQQQMQKIFAIQRGIYKDNERRKKEAEDTKKIGKVKQFAYDLGGVTDVEGEGGPTGTEELSTVNPLTSSANSMSRGLIVNIENLLRVDNQYNGTNADGSLNLAETEREMAEVLIKVVEDFEIAANN